MSGMRAVLAVVLVAGAAAATACAEPEPEPTSEPAVLVVEDPATVVVSGTDTTRVYAPTVFVFAGIDPDRVTSPSEAQTLVAIQQGVRSAQGTLEDLGVRVVHVERLPVVVQRPPGAPASAAGAGLTGPVGYLFADGSGQVRTVDGTLDARGLVCTASATFGLGAPGC